MGSEGGNGRKAKGPERYIAKVDSTRSRGYLVRVPGHPTKLLKGIGDGPWPAILEAARRHRDFLVSRQPAALQPPADGVVGAHRLVVKKTTPKDGRQRVYQYAVWVASWRDQTGHTCRRQFSEMKWGAEEARRRAIAARAEGLRARIAKEQS